jgi:hypothetical protein
MPVPALLQCVVTAKSSEQMSMYGYSTIPSKRTSQVPTLFERVFQDIFEMPGLAKLTAEADSTLQFHVIAGYLVNRLRSDGGCPLDFHWGKDCHRWVIQWMVQRCQLSIADFERFLEPFATRLKRHYHWNNYGPHSGFASARLLHRVRQQVFSTKKCHK